MCQDERDGAPTCVSVATCSGPSRRGLETPTWWESQARRPALTALGPSRLAVALGSPTTSAFPGHALRDPSTLPRSRRLGRHRVRPDTFEVTPLVENRPGDAGELVGERNRQY